MVSRRRHRTLYQTETLIFAVHQFLKNFAAINFPDSIFSRVKKVLDIVIFAQNREIR